MSSQEECLIDKRVKVILNKHNPLTNELPKGEVQIRSTTLRIEFARDKILPLVFKDIMTFLVQQEYNQDYLKGEELIEFATKITDELMEAFPDKGNDILENITEYMRLSSFEYMNETIKKHRDDEDDWKFN
jgi:hypothetical protein